MARDEPVKVVLSTDACRHLLGRPLRGLWHPLRPLHPGFRLHLAAVVLKVLCFGGHRQKKYVRWVTNDPCSPPQPVHLCYDAVTALDTSGQ